MFAANKIMSFLDSRLTVNVPSGHTTLADLRNDRAWGPFLKYVNYDLASQQYLLSVLVVVTQDVQPESMQLVVWDQQGSSSKYAGEKLATWDRYVFVRFRFSVAITENERSVQYQVAIPVLGPDDLAAKQYTFNVPGRSQDWHWAFYSCNGFHEMATSNTYNGIQPLWQHVLHQHTQQPMHLLVGGGDQLYCDYVWDGPVMNKWRVAGNQAADPAETSPFTQEMQRECEEFYFSHYCKHWAQPMFRQALACIPSVMVWDDHDIFDGWGSYEPKVMSAPVMQGVYRAARLFYLLFQLHTTDELRERDGYWGSRACAHSIVTLGSRTAAVLLDSRTARQQKQIVPPEDYEALRARLLALPQGLQHVVMVLTVPVVYPKLNVQAVLQELNNNKAGKIFEAITSLVGSTGVGASIAKSRFGMVEILDDIIDHWDAKEHEAERDGLIRMLQEVAEQRGVRITLLGGDVHCCAYGQIFSATRDTNTFELSAAKPFESDPRFIPQVVSSAIGNEPPPAPLLKVMEAAALVPEPLGTLQGIKQRMVPMFGETEVALPGTLLCGRRNWCEVSTLSAPLREAKGGVNPGALQGGLQFTLHVEQEPGQGAKALRSYAIQVPRLHT